uniref:CCR4-NOT transcription complex subunit 10 n=1 Tax=Chrysotila carterae TaxID=13221 RepID=A0A7S4BQF3_CHRCT
MGHEADEGAPELAVLAGSAYADGDVRGAWAQLQKLLIQRESDPKVLHNAAIAEFALNGGVDRRKLLATLERLRARVDEARAEAETGDSAHVNELLADADASLISYNIAVLLFQSKQYARCRGLLEEMFTNIEPVDEFLAFKACFLLLEVLLLQRQADRAGEVLAYLERSYATLTKVEGGKENGIGDLGEGGEVRASPSDWPNKRSARRPPTDVAPDEVRAALNVYKAKLSLMARSSKSSKREIKSTLNACAQSTTGLFLKSNLEYQRYNYRKAIKLLSNSCQKSDVDPNVAALYFNNMGCVHHCMRRHTAAAFYFNRALSENRALYANRPDKAAAALSTFSCDRRCEIEYNLGLQLLLSAKPAAAFSAFHNALKLLHSQPRLWLRIAESCTALHLQQQRESRDRDGGHGIARYVIAGAGAQRRLVLPTQASADAADIALVDDQAHINTTTNTTNTNTNTDATNTSASATTTNSTDGSSTVLDAEPAPTLTYAINCLHNALRLCDTHRRAAANPTTVATPNPVTTATPTTIVAAAATATAANSTTSSCSTMSSRAPESYSALVAASALGSLSLADEQSLSLYTVEWVALLQLSWISLTIDDFVSALAWANKLLATRACSATLRLYAHLYAADALCHLSRSSEAEQHVAAALENADALATVATTLPNPSPNTSTTISNSLNTTAASFNSNSSAVASNLGCGPSATATASTGAASNSGTSTATIPASLSSDNTIGAEGDIGSVRNPYAHITPGLEAAGASNARAVLYSNLASVQVLQGQLAQAEQCVRMALMLQPKQHTALLCLVYIELRNGRTDAALDILKRQRLPAPTD